MATLLMVEKKQSSSPCRRERSFFQSQFTTIWLSPWRLLGEHASHNCALNKTTSYESMNSLEGTVVTKGALAIVIFDIHLHALMATDHILYRHGCQPSWFWQDSPDTLISVLIVDSSSCACRLEDRQGPLMGWRLQDNDERAVSLGKKMLFIEICKLET